MSDPLYVIDTGTSWDRPVQKGQWAVSDIEEQGVAIIKEWYEEKAKQAVSELRFVEINGTGQLKAGENIHKIVDFFDVKITVDVELRKKRRKATSGRKAKR